MNKTFAASLLALALPTAACGTVDSPDDVADDPTMTEPTPDDGDGDGTPADPEPEMPKPRAGTVDTSFGTNGYLKLDGVLGYPVDAVVQGTKLVVCSTATIDGKARAVLARVGFDGAVDDTFGIQDGRFLFGDNSYCGSVALRPDGSLVAFTRVPGNINAIWGLDGDAQTFDLIASSGTAIKAMQLTANDQILAAATTAGGFSSRDAENPTDIASIAGLTGSITRPFMINGAHAIAGVFTNGVTGWTLLVEQTEGAFPMPTKILDAGTATKDFMHDAVQLADGSILAVGSADSELDAMVGRLPVDGDPVAEVRDIGLTSTFRHVMLDGADHALLFGTTSMNGTSHVMWQRIATTSLAVDPAYAGGGTMVLPALQGSGDISTAFAYDGAIYVLTSFDVQAVSPGAALLKIHE